MMATKPGFAVVRSSSVPYRWRCRRHSRIDFECVIIIIFSCCWLAASWKAAAFAFQPSGVCCWSGQRLEYSSHHHYQQHRHHGSGRRLRPQQPCPKSTFLHLLKHGKRYPRKNDSCPIHRPEHSSTSRSTATQLSLSSSSSSSTEERRVTRKGTRATSVYALILLNLVVFVLDKVWRNPFIRRNLYLYHSRWHWWQPLTSCFCHMDRNHLSSNLFLLLLFGRSVEDDQGWGGLIFSFAFCGILSSLVSLFMLPRYTVSIGASGAVFGLFAVSTLGKLSWSELFNWRKLVETAVLGEFVFRQILSEAATAASGGTAGVNHVAHLSGAAAGAMLVFGLRSIVGRLESRDTGTQKYLK
jgi:membrane associated rhomboid family serine protease